MSGFGKVPLPLPAVPKEKNTIAAANVGKRNNLLFTAFWSDGIIFKRFSYTVPFCAVLFSFFCFDYGVTINLLFYV